MGNIKVRKQPARVVVGLMMTTTYSKLDQRFLKPQFSKQLKGRLDSGGSVVGCGIGERKKKGADVGAALDKKLRWQDLLKER
jgi:hypothetical protein